MISLYDGISEMYPSGGEKKAVCVKPKGPLDVGLRLSVTAPLNVQLLRKGLLHLWFPGVSPVHDKCSIHKRRSNEL